MLSVHLTQSRQGALLGRPVLGDKARETRQNVRFDHLAETAGVSRQKNAARLGLDLEAVLSRCVAGQRMSDGRGITKEVAARDVFDPGRASLEVSGQKAAIHSRPRPVWTLKRLFRSADGDVGEILEAGNVVDVQMSQEDALRPKIACTKLLFQSLGNARPGQRQEYAHPKSAAPHPRVQTGVNEPLAPGRVSEKSDDERLLNEPKMAPLHDESLDGRHGADGNQLEAAIHKLLELSRPASRWACLMASVRALCG